MILQFISTLVSVNIDAVSFLLKRNSASLTDFAPPSLDLERGLGEKSRKKKNFIISAEQTTNDAFLQ